MKKVTWLIAFIGLVLFEKNLSGASNPGSSSLRPLSVQKHANYSASVSSDCLTGSLLLITDEPANEDRP